MRWEPTPHFLPLWCHPNIGIQFMKNPQLIFLSRNLGSEGLLWLASGGRQIQLYLFEKAGSSFYYWTTPQSGGISSLLRICNPSKFRPWLGQSFEKLRILLKQNTALLSTVHPSVRPSVTGVTSHFSHIYKGINAMLIIWGPIKPCIFWIKIILAIFLAKTRPDKTIFSAMTNLTTKYINAESALFTLSCLISSAN